MCALDKEFPIYGFGQHKGYPTGAHVAAVHAHGPCKYHRMTFAPLKHMKKKSVNKTLMRAVDDEKNLTEKSAAKKRKESIVDTTCVLVDAREERLRRRNILKDVNNN
jgi:hypothetical protein